MHLVVDENYLRKAEANPYRAKIFDYPGALLPFINFADDRLALLNRIESAKNVLVEIGSGSGRHLIARAVRSPDQLTIGFERRYKRAVRTVEKALRLSATNLIVARLDVRALEQVLPQKSVSTLVINFPDPWRKTRHRENRVLSGEFLTFLSQFVRLGGELLVKTDSQEYFAEFLEDVALRSPFSLESSTEDFYRDNPDFDGALASEFELLFRSQGLPVCFARAVLPSDADSEAGRGDIA